MAQTHAHFPNLCFLSRCLVDLKMYSFAIPCEVPRVETLCVSLFLLLEERHGDLFTSPCGIVALGFPFVLSFWENG